MILWPAVEKHYGVSAMVHIKLLQHATGHFSFCAMAVLVQQCAETTFQQRCCSGCQRCPVRIIWGERHKGCIISENLTFHCYFVIITIDAKLSGIKNLYYHTRR